MNERKGCVFFLSLLAWAALPAFAGSIPPGRPGGAMHAIVLEKGVSGSRADAVISNAGGSMLFWFPEIGVAVAMEQAAGFVGAMAGRKPTLRVGPVGTWSLPAAVARRATRGLPVAEDGSFDPYQWNIRRVGADIAWANGYTGSHETVVAIIDSGVDPDHPDLAPNLIYSECMRLHGPCPEDTLVANHGTHVAGIVGAAFGGGRAVGVAPEIGLASYQVFEETRMAHDPVIWWAMLDAAARGVRVINLSLGSYANRAKSRGEGAAAWTAWNRVVNHVLRQGVVIVASAGNAGLDVNGSVFHVPGDIPGVINVGASAARPVPVYPGTDFQDVLAFYSNTGAAVDIMAPGGDCGDDLRCSGFTGTAYPWYRYMVYSTLPGEGYGWMAGTSMAAPHVAAAAGLLLDQRPYLNPHQVRSILVRAGERIRNGLPSGTSMLDVDGALIRERGWAGPTGR